MIEVNHLVKKYGSHYAVDDLSFTIDEGKIYGFLGPNGAGKSTTMNIITGYLAATSGEVRINGLDILKNAEEAKKQIGYLPEIPPLYPDMTVQEYLDFVAELKQVAKKERKAHVEEIMQETHIEDMGGRLIANLSKGYKQRVGLAQAMIGNPEIIILDEPTVGLDPKQILEIRDLIRSMKEKHTIILSSHILSEVAAVCDQVLILSQGKLVASDTTENLSRKMEHKETMKLELTIRGTKAQVEDALQQEDYLELIQCEEKAQETGEECEVVVEAKEGRDIREQLFYLLADKKLPLLKMVPETRSLEDVFLELTEGEGQEEREEQEDDSNI